MNGKIASMCKLVCRLLCQHNTTQHFIIIKLFFFNIKNYSLKFYIIFVNGVNGASFLSVQITLPRYYMWPLS